MWMITYHNTNRSLMPARDQLIVWHWFSKDEFVFDLLNARSASAVERVEAGNLWSYMVEFYPKDRKFRRADGTWFLYLATCNGNLLWEY